MRSPRAAAVIGRLLITVSLGACATVEPSKPIVEFPSEAALATIEKKPVAKIQVVAAAEPAEAWTVEAQGTSTALFQPWSPATPAENVLARAYLQSGRPPRFSKAMNCVAREMGRFMLQTKGSPADGLRQFLVGACGAIVRDVMVGHYGGEVPAQATDLQIVTQYQKGFADFIAKNVPADADEIGVWFGRADGRAVTMAAFYRSKARFRPFSLVPPASGEVTIEGQIDGPAEYISAYVNRGRYATDWCFVDPSVPRPQFRITCEMAAEDATTWVQLVYAPPKRVLAVPFAQFLLRRDPAQVLTHKPEAYAPAQPVASAQEFSRVVLEQLNQVRRTAELPVVKLASAQSLTAANLAGHYFAAALNGQEPAVMDTVALGLMAGRQVSDGMIRDASFVAGLVPHTRDAGRWLTETLAMPIGRVTLLDPSIEAIALGPVLTNGPDSLGALVTGYRFYRDGDHSTDVVRLFRRVAAARKKLNLAKPARIAQLGEAMRSQLAQVHQGQSQPMEALQSVLESGVNRFGRGMRGYVVEATSLDALEIPEEILKQPTLHMEIGVTHHRPAGASWGQLVILVAYVDYDDSV